MERGVKDVTFPRNSVTLSFQKVFNFAAGNLCLTDITPVIYE